MKNTHTRVTMKNILNYCSNKTAPYRINRIAWILAQVFTDFGVLMAILVSLEIKHKWCWRALFSEIDREGSFIWPQKFTQDARSLIFSFLLSSTHTHCSSLAGSIIFRLLPSATEPFLTLSSHSCIHTTRTVFYVEKERKKGVQKAMKKYHPN